MVLSPKRAVSLSGETVMHMNLAFVGQNNEREDGGSLILVGLGVGVQEDLVVGMDLNVALRDD